MRKLLSVALLVCSSNVCAADRQITFNGVPLGVPEGAFKNLHPSLRCDAAHWTNLMADRTCAPPRHAGATFAGIAAIIHASFLENRLASVTVYVHAPFGKVTSQLFEAFGMPDSQELPAIEQRTHAQLATWRAGGVTLQALSLSSDQTELIYRADWLAEEFTKRRAAQQQRWAWLTDQNRVTSFIERREGRQ